MPESMTATPTLVNPVVSATRGRPSVSRSVEVCGPASTTIGVLAATFRGWSAANRRTSYVPGIIGAVNWTLASAMPVTGGVDEPLRYFQPRYAESAPPAGASDTQSFLFPGPCTSTVMTPPGATVGVRTLTFAGRTETVPLIANLVQL